MEILKEHKDFLYLTSFVTIIRLLLAPWFGLGGDEAHYALYSLNLDLSYFDHPPLVGWTQYLFTSLFGIHEFGVRVAPILIGLLVSIFIYKLIYDINKNTKEAFVSVLALYASFMFNALFLMLVPDTLLFLLLLPIIFTVIKVEQTDSISMWILLGVLLGFAGLSKYTAILLVIPIIVYLIIKKRFKLFYSPKILVTIFISLAMISPVVIWNFQHDWISFTYQSNHVVGDSHINWSGFIRSILTQFGAYNPFLFFVAFYGLYKASRSKNDSIFLSALFGWVLILFFTYASLYKTALPHWSAIFYLLFIPIGTYYLLAYKKFLKIAIGFGLLLSGVVYSELAFNYIPFPDYKSPHRDIYGWDTIMKEANREIKNPKREALAVTNWSIASRALFYNKNYNSKVYLIDNRYDQFDIWEKDSPIGKNIIVINTHFFKKDVMKYMQCDKLKQLKSFDITLNNSKVNSIQLLECQNYQGLKKQ